jgi:LuxR family maltose regulon positive regulatory protein
VVWPNWLVSVFVLEAIVRDALSDRAAAWRALERALDIAEPDRMLFPFLIYRAPGLLERHARSCAKHAALVSGILTLLPPLKPGPAEPAPDGYPGPRAALGSGKPPRGEEWSGEDRSPELIEPLSRSEMRVLRYLPTNLSAPEIARELSVSVTTVRTHISHLFAKLGVHRRTEAVARARDLGLLAPSPMRRAGQPRATG